MARSMRVLEPHRGSGFVERGGVGLQLPGHPGQFRSTSGPRCPSRMTSRFVPADTPHPGPRRARHTHPRYLNIITYCPVNVMLLSAFCHLDQMAQPPITALPALPAQPSPAADIQPPAAPPTPPTSTHPPHRHSSHESARDLFSINTLSRPGGDPNNRVTVLCHATRDSRLYLGTVACSLILTRRNADGSECARGVGNAGNATGLAHPATVGRSGRCEPGDACSLLARRARPQSEVKHVAARIGSSAMAADLPPDIGDTGS